MTGGSKRAALLREFSKRSLAIYAVYCLLLIVGAALVLAVVVSIAGYFVLGWEGAPVPEVTGLLTRWAVYAFVPLLILRLLLHWSRKKDAAAKAP